MKNKNIFLPMACLLLLLITGRVAAQQDAVVTAEVIKLQYFNNNNNVQYLLVESLLKTGRKTAPIGNKKIQLYLNSNEPGNLIASILTDKNGKAKSFIPPALKAAWQANTLQKFIAVMEGKEEETITELEITKAKIQIDTASDRNILVQVRKYENSEWMPADEVEVKVGIRRLGGILNAGDEELYTTDSGGNLEIAFTRNNLPGDQKGNIMLVAKIEDNDLYGNLVVEQTVPWGIAVKPDNNFFNQRTLWSTRFRTPFWLLFMAYSIVIAVWGTIIYLVLQIVKIKKLGTATSS